MDMEHLFGMMEVAMTDSSKIIVLKDSDIMYGLTKESIKVHGKITK